MIQPLRSAHRRTSMALALILPAVLVVGLMARRPLPHPYSKTHNSEARQSIGRSDHLWSRHRIHSVFLRNASGPATVQVVLEPLDDFSAPDLLVYWSPALPVSDQLATNAVLLGAFENGRPLLLQESNTKGFLILYSLAHHTIVDTSPLERVL